MGGSPSKKIDDSLETSPAFQVAVDASYEECMALTGHALPGLQAYQLLDAAVRIYGKLILIEDGDFVSKYKDKWLPQAPSQMDVDRTIKKEKLFDGARTVVSLENFRVFATTLFRDMGLGTACGRLLLYVPASSVGFLFIHIGFKRLPVIGPVYLAAGPLLPSVLLASILGVVILKLNPAS